MVLNCPHIKECGICIQDYDAKEIEDDFSKEHALSYEYITNSLFIGYRNRGLFRTRIDHNGDLAVGYHKPGGREFVPIVNCMIMHESIQGFLFYLAGINDKRLKEKAFRFTVDTLDDGLLVTLVKAEGHGFFEEILKGYTKTKVTYQGDDALYLIEKIADRSFYLSAGGFRQSRNDLNHSLRKIVLDYVTGDDYVYDMYCGNANLTKLLKNDHTRGFDQSGGSLIAANTGARGKYESLYSPKGENFWVIDPPRVGLLHKLPDYIEKIIYFSCHLDGLKKDWAEFSNFQVKKSFKINMFPYSGHYERVFYLERL